MRLRLALAGIFLVATMGAQHAAAAEPPACQKIRIADGGWTDNQVTNGFATVVLEALGYKTEVSTLQLGVLLEGLKLNKLDVFLDSWTPNSDAILKPYEDAGAIRNVGTNLTGAQYSLAVPSYAYDAGLRDFSDIEKFRDQLDGKIFALEAGNDSNALIIQMQKDKAFGFENFKMMESSEQGMLGEVERAVQRKKPIVFVAWSPHPMNARFQIKYLAGGDKYFGPNLGSASVWTGVRPGYADECPNALKFFQNLRFTVELESAAMQRVLDNNEKPVDIAKDVLRQDPSLYKAWLAGVTTFDGASAEQAVADYLK